MTEQEWRLLAIQIAIETEGPKGNTAEVLKAAEEIFAFLQGSPPDRRP